MQQTPTKLSLDRWARIMGINNLHFWGVALDSLSRTANAAPVCGTPIFQYDWQDFDRVSREEVAQAIAEAEADIESIVGYRLLPSWEEDEWVPTSRPARRDVFNLNSNDVRGLGQVIFPKWGWMISGGIRSVDVIDQDAAVSYANDGTTPAGFKNQATVTFTPAAELPDCEIGLFYPDHAGEEAFRIRPIVVSHDASFNYTVTFNRELAVVQTAFDTYDLANLRPVDGLTDASFLTTVAIARVYNDPQQQATYLWEAATSCGCSGAGCGVCGYATTTACFITRGDPRLSHVVPHPATWDADTNTFVASGHGVSRQPDAVRLWYYSGWRDKGLPCPTVEMDGDWARVVAYFAASKLDRPLCDCSGAATQQWQADLAFTHGAEELAAYSLSASDLDSPFGTRRGAVMAWRRCKRRGTAIGRVAVAP